jgi:bifunctional UDP-N-acetylglucosamine pyrophosphorylase / glucosamine-1-phosphate N-acetyltransferase
MADSADDVHLLILAAGKGTRMKARVPKVLHRLNGRRLIDYVLDTAEALSPASVTLVIGHQGDEVRSALSGRPGLQFAVQEPQLGTGHAVLQARPFLEGRAGTAVLLSADVPLLRAETLRRLVAHHCGHAAAATVVTAHLERPYGYGRIVRSGERLIGIVEERDASTEQRRIKEINSGIYAFDLAPLFDAIERIGADNSQREYYLPDLVAIYRRSGLGVETIVVDDPTEIRGVNSQSELAELGSIVRQTRVAELMAAGVTVEDPATTYVGPDVEVEPDTLLHPNVYLEGRTRIGPACEIHAGSRIVDSTIGEGTVVFNYCVIEGAVVGPRVRVGPFARLRPESDVREEAHVGNFVELKKTVLGKGSKANHLTYLGDATIGDGVNVGAGTITCNYDGTTKHPTVIEDGVFIGSDSQLVAPVTIGKGAYVAAGSSITENVPAGSLAIARGRQVVKDGWAEARRRQKAGSE